jgi:P2 family phage contractile tail tube protein
MLLPTKKGAILATSVYIDGKLCADDAEITPPDVEFQTATLQEGGEIEVPLAGLVNSMELGITTQGISNRMTKLAQPQKHKIVCNAVQQVVGIDGLTYNEQVKYTFTGFGKKVPATTTKQGEASSQEYTVSLISYKAVVGGEVITNVNKLTGDCVIHGIDYGTTIRALL